MNVALLAATVVWLLRDGRAPHTLADLWQLVESGNPRFKTTTIVRIAAAAGAVSFALVLIGLMAGPRRCRQLSAWLTATALTCGWCTLFVTWSELHWHAQQFRLASVLPEATTLAEELAANWPDKDGDLQGVGPFMAYPKSAPATLMLLGDSRVPGTSVQISAVERTSDGTLRLELAGRERGAWLEWRPADSVPSSHTPGSFLGGLNTYYSLKRCAALDTDWFVVRYAAAPGY